MHWREHDENVLNMIVPDLGTVSMKNLIMIIFMWDDAHGLMHTSKMKPTTTAILCCCCAANEDSHRLKKCRWNTFTLKLRWTTLRCSIFVFMNDFWCLCVLLLLLMICLLFVSKHRSLTEYQVLCGRNCAALLNIPFRWFELFFRQFSFSCSFYLSFRSTVWRLMLTAFQRRQCYLVIYFISKSYAKLILIDSKK